MIPKKIHYVWIGGGEKNSTIKKCMKSWERHLSDYEIIEWNESNFDIQSNKFTSQAYAAKKWAYVSDYIRAYALREYGGIYLDTDVMVLENFDRYLSDRAFVGFENETYPFTAAFGAEAGHPLLSDMLAYFDGRDFTFDSNNQMSGVNTKSVSDILINKYHCKADNSKQTIDEGIVVYPDGVLCNPSADSTAIHIFTGTWMEGAKPFARKVVTRLKLSLTTKRRAALYKKLVGR